MLGRSRPRSPGPPVSRVGGRDLRSGVSRSLRLPWVEALPPGQCPRLACGPAERHASVLHVVTLLACAVTIYLACEWFINAIEWLGVELKVGPLSWPPCSAAPRAATTSRWVLRWAAHWSW